MTYAGTSMSAESAGELAETFYTFECAFMRAAEDPYYAAMSRLARCCVVWQLVTHTGPDAARDIADRLLAATSEHTCRQVGPAATLDRIRSGSLHAWAWHGVTPQPGRSAATDPEVTP